MPVLSYYLPLSPRLWLSNIEDKQNIVPRDCPGEHAYCLTLPRGICSATITVLLLKENKVLSHIWHCMGNNLISIQKFYHYTMMIVWYLSKIGFSLTAKLSFMEPQ